MSLSTTLTGVKDVDYLVMEQLDDRSLINLCLTDRYTAGLCSNDTFWKKRTISKFLDVKKPENSSWRNYYLFRLSHEIISIEIAEGINVEIIINKNSHIMQRLLQEFKEYVNEENVEIDIPSDEKLLILIAEALAPLLTSQTILNRRAYEDLFEAVVDNIDDTVLY